MAVTKPVNVPEKKITSLDITGFSGGLYLNGEENGKGNQFVEGKDIELTINGLIAPRRSLERFLPDTVGTVYEVFPALINNEIIYFTADNGKIRYCKTTDTVWTDCTGANTITTGLKIKPRFLRVQDKLLILNGDGGDKLAHVDLATKVVTKYAFVADPVVAPTAAPTVLTNSGSYKIYYGYTFSSPTGETKLSPILSYTINKTRDTWKSDGTEFLTVSRPAGIPAGATYWNAYIALDATGGVIQESNMLLLASGLDLSVVSLIDNGTLPIDIGRGNPPTQNSTDGPRCRYGVETNGRPVIFGDVDNPYNVWIGGVGEFALDFSSSNGGYRAEVSKGTNYYPASVIGFRNGQGVPALTILFSNTQGLSKQATLEEQTINFGNQSFVVWGVTEQNYGAAGVAASHGVINYKGQLAFPSTDGFMSMDTQPQLQNVLATKNIDNDVLPYVRQIKVSALKEVVGTAWNNRQLWVVPAFGVDTPTQIMIRDMDNNGSWAILDVQAQWIGTVSPPDTPAFVYICQGNQVLKLFKAFGSVDFKGGASDTFSTNVKGSLIGINEAYNGYQAVVQAVFYVLNIMGSITVGVNYRNQAGKIKTKSKTFVGPQYAVSTAAGWSDPHYTYGAMPMLGGGGWGAIAPINESGASVNRVTKRIPLQINDLASAVQWWISTEKSYNDYILKSVVYEGENLGVKPDLR